MLLLKPTKSVLNGKEINLTSDDINISSTNFKVDKDGNLECNNATVNNANIVGGKINLTAQKGTVLFRAYEQNKAYTNITPGGIDMTIDENADMGYYYQAGIAEMGENTYIGYYSMIGDDGSETKATAGGVNYWSANGLQTTVQGSGIRTPILTQTSKVQEKKNFEKLENALDIVKATDIYKYNLKNEEDNTKKHIGFVIGDNYNYSKEITSQNNDGVDIYSMVSVCMKAIQEQQEQIEILKQEINKLKGEK